jgi:hypothetical protein
LRPIYGTGVKLPSKIPHFIFIQQISVLNILKTKRNQFYIRNQSVPRSKHFPLKLLKKTNQLIMYKAKVAVCSEIRTKYINAKRAPCRIILILNLVERKEKAKDLKC